MSNRIIDGSLVEHKQTERVGRMVGSLRPEDKQVDVWWEKEKGSAKHPYWDDQFLDNAQTVKVEELKEIDFISGHFMNFNDEAE